jgi:hypothetical protein
MKNVLKTLLGILEIVVIIFAIFMVSTIFLRNKFGYTQFGKNTWIIIDDMNITELTHFEPGELVIVKEALFKDIKVGDELYYYDTVNDEYIIRTGVVKSKTGDNRSALYVFEEVPQNSISSDRIVGKYHTSHSSLGTVIGFLQSTAGFLIFVILPILVLFIYQVYNLVMIIKYDKE